MNIFPIGGPQFGWNIKTHSEATKKAVENNSKLDSAEKEMLGKFSQMPDLIKDELNDMNSAHFYDVYSKDPSYGTKNDDVNNAFSKFLSYTKKAMQAKERETFLKHLGFASHYLQDASTPPHVEHGNYFHKLYRLPMHIMFENGKKYGANSHLEEFKKSYTYEKIPFTNYETLFHNTALYSVRNENKVGYDNVKQWFDIQKRCFNRSVNVTKTYIDQMIKYLPEKNIGEQLNKVI